MAVLVVLGPDKNARAKLRAEAAVVNAACACERALLRPAR
jgi:hypothetical protein